MHDWCHVHLIVEQRICTSWDLWLADCTCWDMCSYISLREGFVWFVCNEGNVQHWWKYPIPFFFHLWATETFTILRYIGIPLFPPESLSSSILPNETARLGISALSDQNRNRSRAWHNPSAEESQDCHQASQWSILLRNYILPRSALVFWSFSWLRGDW